ncbi:MAG TPA: peptidylprolyl isomerase [Gemmatimonadales bacterium]|nr:peptidylprolyl isomerase [Gemmatimonadales bacterium]
MRLIAVRTAGAALGLLLLAGADARPAAAQQSAAVEVLAPVLQAEDSRRFDEATLTAAMSHPDSFVRSTAAIAIGRIGDARGLDLLVRGMSDPDTTVRLAAVFGLGLLRDTAAIGPILERLRAEPVLDLSSAVEAMTTLAKIGGPQVGDIFRAILDGRAALDLSALELLRRQIALESWRLGPDAPVASLLPLVSDTSSDMRWRAVYSLSRLRPVSAARRLAEAVRDPLAYTRAAAVRAFTPGYVDSAGLGRTTIARLLTPLLTDDNAGVRIAALRAVGALGDTSLVGRVADRLDDPMPNVRVAAIQALGDLGGPVAARELGRMLDGKPVFAMGRAALIALARVDTAAARPWLATWSARPDWAGRMAAAEAGAAYAGRPALLDDRDPRVASAALLAWSSSEDPPGQDLLAEARTRLRSSDAVVRAVAAGILARVHDPSDVGALADAYGRAARDSFPDAALAALDGLRQIAQGSTAAAAAVQRQFLGRARRPDDYVIRAWAESAWPAAAARWGPAYPLDPGRTLQDYREILRRYVVAPDSVRRPHVIIETEQRGNIELELMGPEAPLTVANFLSLVDRHFFDGNRWHRVVPDFVVQDGDPRGDGWGSSGTPIRDEINRQRYVQPLIGMALSGPDTGSSQWFINLSPQPHLDGTYTVFGKVVGGLQVLTRITQGDIIRTIRR